MHKEFHRITADFGREDRLLLLREALRVNGEEIEKTPEYRAGFLLALIDTLILAPADQDTRDVHERRG